MYGGLRREARAVKINEVERLAGITKGNIRFYEKEGLLTPGRNSENGYRDYGEADVEWLKKIRLLRMLDVPIEEIKRLKSGELTLKDAMDRHVIQLERRKASLAEMAALCASLKEDHARLDTLDADGVLARMAQKEQEGTKFVNVKKTDKIRRYVAPTVVALLMTLLMAAPIGLIVWAYTIDPEYAPPLWTLVILIAVPVVVIFGVLYALIQRIREIGKGEEDEARKY